MNILMITNTYTPHRGGVARSVEAFTAEYRRLGHDVLVIAPEFDDLPADEAGVVRVPAIQHFNGSDFSVVFPVPGFLGSAVDRFEPDIVHSHHPFLLGTTAFRLASSRGLPLVFTHHTMYEHYTHYVPGDSPAMKRFVIDLATNYANLCDRVIAPSRSIAEILAARGVVAPIEVIPTGISLAAWRGGNGAAFRKDAGIPTGAFVVGHVGRLAAEKNLRFLATAVARLLDGCPSAAFLVVGSGEAEADLRRDFEAAGHGHRLYCPGPRDLPALADAYAAMHVFAFASRSETQGMVLAEAMAAGVPVVALDAPGVREIVRDGANGRLLPGEDAGAFSRALAGIAGAGTRGYGRLSRGALETAEAWSIGRSAVRGLDVYARLRGDATPPAKRHYEGWVSALRLLEAEWEVLSGLADAASAAFESPSRRSGAP